MRARWMAVPVVLAACSRGSPSPSPAPPASASTSASARAPLARAPRVVPPCRVVGGTRLVGEPTVGALTLAAGDRVVVRQPDTARELTFVGPADVTPCEADGAWLRRGVFQSTLGAGDTPGAQQWVVTPHAVVAYGGALVDVDVDPHGTRVRVQSGQATVYGPGGDVLATVAAGVPYVVPGSIDAGDLAASCDEARARLAELTQAPPDAASHLVSPDALARSVTVHRAARITCAIAALRGSERR